MLTTSTLASPIGRLRVSVDSAGHLHEVALLDRSTGTSGRTDVADDAGVPSEVEAVRGALDRYFGGDLAALDDVVVAADRGTDFQRTVWAALRAIPPGATVTYGELADRIGRPRAVRAVGSANGANPIPIVVPCHRVVATGGGLGGYALGLDVKAWLLGHEGARPRPLAP